MTKTKELARAKLKMIDNHMLNGGMDHGWASSLAQLCNAVLSEPDEELRDWKAKARPFLETNLAYFKLKRDSSTNHRTKIMTLTELLKEQK